MGDVQQDVNQDGQYQPLQDTSSGEIELDTSTQEGVDQGDVISADQDDKGVSYKNRFMEAERKRQSAEERAKFLEDFVQKQSTYQPQHPAQQQQQPAQPVGPTDDQLWELAQSGGEHAGLARQELERRMSERVIAKVTPQVQAQTSKQFWEQKALQEFPDLGNAQSVFRRVAAEELNYLNPNLHDVVYRAAQNAARRLNVGQQSNVQQIEQTRDQKLVHQVSGKQINKATQKNDLEELTPGEHRMASYYGNDPKIVAKYKKELMKQQEAFRR